MAPFSGRALRCSLGSTSTRDRSPTACCSRLLSFSVRPLFNPARPSADVSICHFSRSGVKNTHEVAPISEVVAPSPLVVDVCGSRPSVPPNLLIFASCQPLYFPPFCLCLLHLLSASTALTLRCRPSPRAPSTRPRTLLPDRQSSISLSSANVGRLVQAHLISSPSPNQ